MSVADIHPIAATDDAGGWVPVNLVDLPDKPPVKPSLGAQLLYPGKRHVFSGPPESAKTLAAYTMLILAARHNGRGLLIDFEMGAYEARQRLRDLGATNTELALIGYLEPDTPATTSLIEQLVAIRPDLVVIDAAAGAYDISGLDDNKRQDVERFSRLYVGTFWKAGIATILVDHVTKNVEARGKFTIGSERKLGASDVHLGFDTTQAVSRGTTGRYKITTHKDRGGYLKRGHLADLHLNSDPETHVIEWTYTAATDDTAEGGYFRPTHLMETVSRHLEPQTAAVTRNHVHEALGGKREYALKAIAALVQEGYTDERDGPNRSKLLTSNRPYRESDDPQAGTDTTTRPDLILATSTGAPAPPPTDDDPEPIPSWFTRSGAYIDTPDLIYLATLAPDDEAEDA